MKLPSWRAPARIKQLPLWLVSLVLLVGSLYLLIWTQLFRLQAHRGPAHAEPRLLFWTLTVDSRENRRKVAAIRDTWARRADKLLLISNGTRLGLQPDNQTLSVFVGPDHRDWSWLKVQRALRYLHAHHLHSFEWFMKTDDDTYVLVDRLKQFLSTKSTREPIYFGHKFTPYVRQGYMSGGSGYVLSRRALKLVVEEGLDRELEQCSLDNSGVEDVEIGACLEAVGVRPGSTLDSSGKPTFLPLSPEQLLSTTDAAELSWYPSYSSVSPLLLGPNCCSPHPISFHYITPELMRLVDWLLYSVSSRTS